MQNRTELTNACHKGTRLRVLTIVDVFTRAVLATEAGQRLPAADSVDILGRLVAPW